MSRVIKFRAWHPSNKDMVIFDNKKAADDLCIGRHLLLLMANKNSQGKDLLMQFSERKDKNGIDIYQDDIIQFSDKYEWYRSPYHSAEKIKEILDDDVKYPYERRVVKLPEDYEWLLSSEIQSCWEVIGNIHQHPELLK